MPIYDKLIDKGESFVRAELGEREIVDGLSREIVNLLLAGRARLILETAKADLAEAEAHLPVLRKAHEQVRDEHDRVSKSAQRLRFAKRIDDLTAAEAKELPELETQERETQDARDAARTAYQDARTKTQRLPELIDALESITGSATRDTLDELLAALGVRHN